MARKARQHSVIVSEMKDGELYYLDDKIEAFLKELFGPLIKAGILNITVRRHNREWDEEIRGENAWVFSWRYFEGD